MMRLLTISRRRCVLRWRIAGLKAVMVGRCVQCRFEARDMIHQDKPDRGADGQAQLTRPRATMRIQRRISVTRVAYDERLVYQDTHLIDRMHRSGQLWDAIHATAHRLYALWLAGRFDPEQTAQYEPYLGSGSWRHGTDETADVQHPYRMVLARLGRNADLVDGLMLSRHPGLRLALLQMALEAADGVIDDVIRECEDGTA